MADKSTVTVTLNIDTQISSFEKSLNTIKNELKKLDLGANIDDGIKNIYRDYENELKRLKQLTADHKLNLVNEKEIKTSLDRVDSLYNNLIKKLESHGVKTSFLKEDAKALSVLRQASKEYEQSIGKVEKTLNADKKRLQELIDLQNKLNNAVNEKSKIAADAKKAELEAQKKLDADAAAYTTGHPNQKRSGWKNTTIYKEDAQALEKAQLASKQAGEAAKQAAKESTEYNEKNKQTIDDLTKSVNGLTKAYNQAKDRAGTLIQDSLQKLTTKQGIDWTQYDVDPSTINSYKKLEEAIAKVKEKGNANLAQVLRTIGDSARQAGKSAGDMRNGFDGATKSLDIFEDKMGEVEQLKNRIAYFFQLNNAVRLFQRAIRSAYETVKDLDKVMTETAVVTDFTVSDMWAQLPEYTARANELGLAIHDVYEASTLYYQQGLKTNEVMAVTNATLRMARIAGLDAAEATDRVTNALRGFNMEITEANANNIADVYSKLAAMSASNVDEISTAMTKVASLANSANMEFETTAAFLSQIIETTRESAETAGTALKTVVARFSEVKKLYSEGELLGNDEEGQEIDVNKVSTALRTAGINLNEFLTGQRGLDEIFMELASKWDSLTIVQQRYIATMAAGSRQQSRFIALMSDYARTQELVSAAQDASGASQAQYEKTLDSLETKLNQLKNAWDEFVMGLAKDEAIKWVVDALTDILGAINKLTANLPGLLKTISRIGIAIGAFRGGKALVGGLIKDVGIQLGLRAKKSGQESAGLFANGFSGALRKIWPQTISDTDLSGVREAFANKLDDLYGSGAANDEVFAKFFSTPNFEGAESELRGVLKEWGAVDEEINEIIPVFQRFQQLPDQAAMNMQNFNTGMQKATTSMVGAGTACMALSVAFNALGWNKMAKGAQVFGAVLMGIGATLPVLGKLFEVLGVKAQIAGFVAQSGWLPFIGIAAAITAAIAGIIAIIAVLIHMSPEKQLERMQQHLKDVEEAASETVDRYNDLKDSIDSLKDSENAISELTQGTTEWKEQVIELNQQYLDLINKMPALAPLLQAQNGRLFIDFSSPEFANVMNQLQASMITGQIQTSMARTAVSQLQLDRAYMGALARVNPEDMPREGRDDALERVSRALANDQEMIAHYRALGVEYNTNQEEYLAALNKAEGGLINVTNAVDDLVNYGRVLIEEGAQIEANNRAIASSIVSTSDLDTSQIDDAMNLIAEHAATAFNVNLVDISKNGTERQLYEKYWEDWMAQNGYHKINIRDAGGIVYNNEQGERHVIGRNQALEQYNAYRSNERGTEIIESLSNIVNSSQFNQAIGRALLSSADLVSSDLISITDKNIQTAWDQLSNEQQKLFADSTGEANVEIFEDWINQNVQALRTALDQSVENGFNNFEDLDIDSGTIQSINNIFKQYQSEYGAAVANNFVDQINEITSGENLDTNALLDFIGSIGDWSKKTVPSVIKEMSDLGIEFGNSEDAIKLLISQLIELDRASSKINLEDFKAILSSSAELLKDLSGRGATDRTFTQDQYDKLLAISPELVNDMVWNGTDWSYIGGSLNSLEAAIRANTDAILGERIKALNEQINIGQAISDSIEQANGGTITSVNGQNFSYEDLYNGNGQVDQGLLAAARRQYLESIGLNSDEFARMTSQALAEYFTTQMDKYYGTNGSVLAENITTRDTYENQQKVAEILNSGQTMTSIQGQANLGIANGENNEYAQAILAQAAAYGVAEQELEAYNNLLDENGNIAEADKKEAQDLLNTIAKSAALAKATKDMENYGKAISNNLKTLEEYDEGSREYNDALKAMTEQTEHFFGGLELPDNFFNAENLQLLQDALDGSDEAWADFIENVNAAQAAEGAWADATIFDVQEVKAVADAVDGTEIHIDGTADVSSIIESMFNAGASAQEVADFLNELGYAHVDFKASNFKSLQEIQEWMNNNPGQTLNGSILGSIEATNVRVPNRGSFAGGAGGGGSSGGGGGGGSKKSWKNPYDELYNLTEDINENLRERNHLEDEYGRIVDRNNKEVAAAYKNNLQARENLYQERRYRDQELAGRRNQLRNIGNRTVETEDGYKTYTEMDVVKYARYNDADNTVEIDWDGIDKIEDTEIGKAVEQYVKDLEELQGQIEDTEDRIIEIDDDLWELEQRGKEEALDMEKRLADALKNQQQKVIDEYQALSETIDNTNSKILDGLQESIDLSRQIRDNTKTEEDIAQKEARLAYLRRDTSGANALEIQQLQQELDEARQSYSDTLIDQSIDRLSQDNQKAADQRTQQIDIMQSQLDYAEEIGEFNRQAEQMLIDAVMNEDFSEIEAILKADERFDAMSSFAQGQWTDEFNSAVVQAYEGAMNFLQLGSKPTLDMTLSQLGKGINSAIQQAGKSSGGSGSSGGLGSSGSSSGGGERTNPNMINDNAYTQGSTYVGVEEQKIKSAAEEYEREMTRYEAALQKYANDLRLLAEYNSLPAHLQSITRKPTPVQPTPPNKSEIARKYGVSVSVFKTGGLADFTGPAWLDGTKSHPELVLNAKDTENFIALRNILSHLMNGQVGGAGTSASGDINLDIDINVDQIGNDYDVDRLVDRVKQNIYQDASYRNINQINFIR